MTDIEPNNPITTAGLKSAGVIALGLVAGLGFFLILALFARPLALLLLAFCIAAAFAPLVTRLAQSLPRNTAILLIYGVLLLLIIGIIALIISPFITQAGDFTERIPDLMERGRQFLSENGISSQQTEALTAQLLQLGQNLITTPLWLFSGVLDAILVLFVSLYLLLDAPKIRRFILSLLNRETHQRIELMGSEMIEKGGGYVRGVAIDSAFIGVVTTIGLSLIGLPFSLVLGVIAGLFEVFPVVGSIIASVPILLVALLQSPTTALITLVFVLVVQQIQGNFITPNVMNEQVSVPQYIVPLAVVAGAGIGGVLGALVAVPLAAILRVFILHVVVPFIRRFTGAEEQYES